MANIHVRLEYEEAMANKKELLYTQMNLLELLKKLKSYKTSRKRELILKSRFKNALKNIKEEVGEIEDLLPEEETGEIKAKRKSKKKDEDKMGIDAQLRDIQEKLAALQ